MRIAASDEGHLLNRPARGVFDWPVDTARCAEFFADPRHHLAVAIRDGTVIGIASGVHYVHPDKDPELFINEIGVAPDFRRQGIGRRLLRCLLDHARRLNCRRAWLLAEPHNAAARALYASVGGHESPTPPVLCSFRWDGLR